MSTLAAVALIFLLGGLAACGPKTAPLAALPEAQAPHWKPGDSWVFTTRTRSPFVLSERMEVKSVGDEIVLIGNGDPSRFARLGKDLTIKEMNGSLLTYAVESGTDAAVFFPLSVGATRTYSQSTSTKRGTQNYTCVLTVEAAEELSVPAGTFKTFRIKVEKKNGTGWSGTYHYWYAPEVGYFVRVVDTRDNSAELVNFTRK